MVDNATGGGCALPDAARMRSVPACLNGAVTNVWTPRVGGDAPTVDDVVGHVAWRYWPLDRIGGLGDHAG